MNIIKKIITILSVLFLSSQTGVYAQILVNQGVVSEKTYPNNTHICYFEVDKKLSEQSKEFLQEKAESNQKIMQLSIDEQLVMFHSVVDFAADSVINFINNIFAENPQAYSENEMPRPQRAAPQVWNAMLFCVGYNIMYPATTGAMGGFGLVGCLSSTPNPTWFYAKIDEPGNLDICISSGYDVDFIAWGPFSSLQEAANSIELAPCPTGVNCRNNTSYPNDYPTVTPPGIVDCSYDAAAVETCHIRNAQSGDIYVLLITNYSNIPTNITFGYIPAPSPQATTACILSSAHSNSPLCVGDTLKLTTDNVPGATYYWTGLNGFTSNMQNPIISNITTDNAGTYTLTIIVNGAIETISIDVVVLEECIDWVFDNVNGVLTISGTGAIPDYVLTNPQQVSIKNLRSSSEIAETSAPWNMHREEILHIVISEGITEIGGYSFYNCVNVKTVELASTVGKIGEYAFANCGSLEEIIHNENGIIVDETAFENVNTSQIKLTVPEGSEGNYNEDTVWGEFIIGNENSVPQTAISLANIYSKNHLIVVENFVGYITIYNVQGQIVTNEYSQNGHTEISIPQAGVYIVKISFGSSSENSFRKIVVK